MTPEELAALAAQQEADRIAAEAAAAAAAAAAAQNQEDPPVLIDGLTEAQVRERLARATELETAQAAAEEAARQAALTEEQRVAEEIATAQRERDTASTALETERTEANNLRLQISIANEARAMNVQLHPTAIADSLQLGDFAAVTFNDAREPQGVKEALTALLEKKPYLQVRVDAPNLRGNDSGRSDLTSGLTGEAAAAAALASASTVHGF